MKFGMHADMFITFLTGESTVTKLTSQGKRYIQYSYKYCLGEIKKPKGSIPLSLQTLS